MTEPNVQLRTPAGTARVSSPALPRLAERAAQDLARPARAVIDGLRALDAWFMQHGDPFAGLPPPVFSDDAQRHQDTFDAVSDMLSTAELVARLRSTYAAFHTRLQRAARTEREE
jgi:hypothetical protein